MIRLIFDYSNESIILINIKVITSNTILDLFNISQFNHIDLRSEKEFKKGTIPNSVNIPILNNEEYEKIGKIYKTKGKNTAINLGLELISGNTKENRISEWQNHINRNKGCSIFCYRGGLRSKIAQEWLLNKNIKVDTISGGYKSVRKTILEYYSKHEYYNERWVILGGLTGSGKTKLLNKFKNSIDIESIANHRGSAFGMNDTPQPSCANFENILAFQNINSNYSYTLFEDESKKIGKATLQKEWYNKMQTSDLIVMDIQIAERVKNIVFEYIIEPLKDIENPNTLRDQYLTALQKIYRRLGDELFKNIYSIIVEAFNSNSLDKHRLWVRTLLEKYYDPMYNHKLDLRKKYIIHKGNFDSCFHYISNQKIH